MAEPDTAFLAYRQGHLEIDGLPLGELAAAHGTPLFVVSERRLLANYRALARGLGAAGAPVSLRYCAKANNEAGILTVLAREGSALLASHGAEVELALACGFPPAQIAYQRPAAPAAEVDAVLGAGVGLVHLFRPQELDPLAAAAARAGRRVRLSLRLRNPRRVSLSPLASLGARLGLSADEALAVAVDCRGSANLEVVGLNVYVGTQQPGLQAFASAFRRACGVARRLADGGVEIEEINLGGGIPSPTLRRLGPRQLWARWRDRAPALGSAGEVLEADSPAAVERFARELGATYRAAAAAAGLARPPALAAEPGRSIVGNAAVLVTRATSAEGGWLFLDASRNFLGESPLLLSRRILPWREQTRPAAGFFHLSGSTLNTMDVIDLHRRLPPARPGDGFALCDAGAYSISRANRYAGMAPPVVLLDRQGSARLIRRAETVADLVGPMEPALPSALDSAAMRRVLVTGAAGFLGQHLVAALLAEGVPTTALYRQGAPLAAILGHPALTVAHGDLRDEVACSALLAGVDAVFHLAAVRNHPGSSARAMEEVNEVATVRLARQAAEAGVGRFVHVATAQVYGPSSSPLDESAPVLAAPSTNAYAAGKGRAMLRLRELAREGAPVVTLLPTIVFGPDHPSHPNRVTRHLRRLAGSRVQLVLGDGAAHRDLVHVGDVVPALLAAARLPGLTGEELLITGETVSARALGALVARCRGRRPPIVARLPLGPARVAARMLDRAWRYDRGCGWASAVDTLGRDWCFRGERARRLLGHRPRPLADGITQTVAWIDAGGSLDR